MKKAYKFLFILFGIVAFSHIANGQNKNAILNGTKSLDKLQLPTGQIQSLPVIRSGEVGDSITRIIQVGPEGATFRFINDKGRYNQLWSDSLLYATLIDENNLDKHSSSFDIVFAVAKYIKRGGYENHIQGYNFPMSYSQDNTATDPMSIISTCSKSCGDFCVQLHIMVNQINDILEIDMILFKKVLFEGHVANLYWDKSVLDWVYLDVDPGCEIFVPKWNNKLVSLNQLIKHPQKIFSDKTSIFLSEDIDPIKLNWAVHDMVEKIGDTSLIETQEIDNKVARDIPTEIKYTLLPNQKIIWNYQLSSLYLNPSYKDNETLDTIRRLFTEGIITDSLSLVDSVLSLSSRIGLRHGISGKLLIEMLFSESIQYSPDSTYIGKNMLREQVFSITYPKGAYSDKQIYIPHLIKSMSINATTSNNFPENFTLKSYNFPESSEVTFYGNDAVQLVPNVFISKGSLSISNYKNGKIIGESISVDKGESKN